MTNLERFMAYAADFEKSYVDNDFSRLAEHFTDDPVYEVDSEKFGCRIEGGDAIFAGMKKSLDGFDRLFTGRNIALEGAPEIGDDAFSVSWKVTYTKEGVEPFVLLGHSRAVFRDGKIALLTDSFDPSVDIGMRAWMKANKMTFDPSYV